MSGAEAVMKVVEVHFAFVRRRVLAAKTQRDIAVLIEAAVIAATQRIKSVSDDVYHHPRESDLTLSNCAVILTILRILSAALTEFFEAEDMPKLKNGAIKSLDATLAEMTRLSGSVYDFFAAEKPSGDKPS